MTHQLPFDKEQINKLVASPSLGTVTYQAWALIQELKKLTDEEYPSQACHIRDVFLCFAEYILEQLLGLYDPQTPLKVKGPAGLQRLRVFAEALQELYSNIRYLWASSPRQSPPSLQVALAQLVHLHFPKFNGEPLCVVRPQWKYNLKYVPLSWQLKQLIAPGVLDPSQENGIRSKEDILPVLWKRWRNNLSKEEQKCIPPAHPKQLAVLSFAGLDTQDALLYPLLAHEIGHFIDHSYTPLLHRQPPLRKVTSIGMDDIYKILDEAREMARWNQAEELWEFLDRRVRICLQELIADLLATRMMGLSFFVSQSEFLKTQYAWSGARILPSGYPGIKFRLSVIFNHLTSGDSPGNVRTFLQKHAATKPELAKPLLNFLHSWEKRLGGTKKATPKKAKFRAKGFWHSEFQHRLNQFIESMIEGALPKLEVLVRKCIPDSNCTRLTPRFFDRIVKLEKELPPSFPHEEENCFAEIMSAAWAYQILYGEKREAQKRTLDERISEYHKTCRLIMKAVDLIPVLQSSQIKVKSRRRQEEEKLEVTSTETSLDDRQWLVKGGVLGAPHIRRRLQLPIGDPAHLSVVPLNLEKIQAASLDVHLSNWFAIFRRTKLKRIQLTSRSDEDPYLPPREEVFVPLGKSFLIHPGDLVLGATMEFLALPADLMAFVEGRSTLGRQGLLINTTVTIAPGFHGVVVLELANTGAVPLEVMPGMTIAQVMFQVLTEPLPEQQLYRGRYYCQIKP